MSDFRHVAEGMGDRDAERERAAEEGEDERLEALEGRIDELRRREEAEEQPES